jgi:hypothetical protein
MKPHPGDEADRLEELKQVQRPRGLENVLDKQSLRILESLALDSFENLSNAFDDFIEDAPLFAGDTSFAKASIALDSAAKLFSQIDFNHDHLIDAGEIEYLLQKTTSENRDALNWLIEHYEAFTRACFFKNGITKDDLESARNVFHGLRLVHEKFGFSEEATPENLQHITPEEIEKYLAANGDSMEPHDKAGLMALLDYIREHAVTRR